MVSVNGDFLTINPLVQLATGSDDGQTFFLKLNPVFFVWSHLA